MAHHHHHHHHWNKRKKKCGLGILITWAHETYWFLSHHAFEKVKKRKICCTKTYCLSLQKSLTNYNSFFLMAFAISFAFCVKNNMSISLPIAISIAILIVISILITLTIIFLIIIINNNKKLVNTRNLIWVARHNMLIEKVCFWKVMQNLHEKQIFALTQGRSC